jgi:hypothetical protein
MSVEAARAALERVADFGPPESKDWPLVNATIAVAEATLALHDVIREALADEAPEQHVEPPAPMEPASLWTPITHDTVWAEGDLVSLLGGDAPVGHVLTASTDSFSDTVLKVKWILDPHDDTPWDDIPVEVLHLDEQDWPKYRRRAKAVAS